MTNSTATRSFDPDLGHAHVLLTGATGFLGQALLERLLAAHPNTRISLLLRAKGLETAQARLRTLLDLPAFRTWRDAVGPARATRAVRDRVTVIEGDLGDVPELPADLDLVLHSASAVAFDQPIDEAFRTNVLGAAGLYDALLAAGADPHVVHISTAYVNAGRRGVVTEGRLEHSVDWRAECAAAQDARDRAEAASREPELLSRLRTTMQRRHGKIGPQATAAATEQARAQWVRDRLVRQGLIRAQSLGWTDVYTFTKACAERVAEQSWARAGRRLSIVRPSIIESALHQPFPGWLDGIKVADPIILAYGRAMLPTFPGLPDTVIDMVPVDVVANATLAVAATGGDLDAGYFHVSSGTRNPLAQHHLYQFVGEYFAEHPVLRDGHPVAVKPMQFPGSRRFERQIRMQARLVDTAERAVGLLPSRRRTRRAAQQLGTTARRLRSLRTHAELYCAYVQTEVIFDDSRTKHLHDALPEGAKATFGFDVGTVDWRDYLHRTHIPAVLELAGAVNAARRPIDPPTVAAPGEPERDDVIAVFDLEGTVVGLNLVEQYLAIRLAQLPKRRWPAEFGALVASAPGFLLAERRDRSEFIRTLARHYQGLRAEAIDGFVSERFGSTVRDRAINQALDCAHRHRAAGHRTVLVTGAPRWTAEPFADDFDEIVAGRVHVADGALTGYLDASPLVGEARASWLQSYARATGADLSASYGYGDSYADVAWLQLVGRAHAINPDARLFRHAQQARWTVQDWS